MDLIYYGPLFRSVIPAKDQKGFVRVNTKRGLGSINKQIKISGKIDRRPYRNFSQAITNLKAVFTQRFSCVRCVLQAKFKGIIPKTCNAGRLLQEKRRVPLIAPTCAQRMVD